MFCRIRFKQLGRMNNQKMIQKEMKNKKCLCCEKEDYCVMLLPCHHEVLCVDCSKSNENCVLCGEKILEKFMYDHKAYCRSEAYRRSKSKLT